MKKLPPLKSIEELIEENQKRKQKEKFYLEFLIIFSVVFWASFFLMILFSGCKALPQIPPTETITYSFKSTPDTMTAIDLLASNVWTDPEGFEHIGGLYPDGLNVPPLTHQQKIQKANNKLTGTIGLLSIGASNCMYESQEFALLPFNENVKFINGALGGKTFEKIMQDSYWAYVHTQVENKGLTTNDVQVVIFESNSFSELLNTASFIEWRNYLADQMTLIAQRILIEFPKVQIVYIGGTTYSNYFFEGYEKFEEPWSYYLSWGIKELIERQINNAPALKCSGVNKQVPVLAWMYPAWSDGATNNSCGFDWYLTDISPAYPGAIENGVHPSVIGAQRVADYWHNFFNTNIYTLNWFGL